MDDPSMLICGLNGHKPIDSAEQMREIITAIYEAGARRFSYYNYGMISRRNLRWIAEAIAAVRALDAGVEEDSLRSKKRKYRMGEALAVNMGLVCMVKPPVATEMLAQHLRGGAAGVAVWRSLSSRLPEEGQARYCDTEAFGEGGTNT